MREDSPLAHLVTGPLAGSARDRPESPPADRLVGPLMPTALPPPPPMRPPPADLRAPELAQPEEAAAEPPPPEAAPLTPSQTVQQRTGTASTAEVPPTTPTPRPPAGPQPTSPAPDPRPGRPRSRREGPPLAPVRRPADTPREPVRPAPLPADVREPGQQRPAIPPVVKAPQQHGPPPRKSAVERVIVERQTVASRPGEPPESGGRREAGLPAEPVRPTLQPAGPPRPLEKGVPAAPLVVQTPGPTLHSVHDRHAERTEEVTPHVAKDRTVPPAPPPPPARTARGDETTSVEGPAERAAGTPPRAIDVREPRPAAPPEVTLLSGESVLRAGEGLARVAKQEQAVRAVREPPQVSIRIGRVEIVGRRRPAAGKRVPPRAHQIDPGIRFGARG